MEFINGEHMKEHKKLVFELAKPGQDIAFATVSNTALDFKTYIQEQQIERLWERVEKQPISV